MSDEIKIRVTHRCQDCSYEEADIVWGEKTFDVESHYCVPCTKKNGVAQMMVNIIDLVREVTV